MKKTSIHLMLSIIFSTIILAGCEKSKDSDEPVAVTKENLAGSYKLTKLNAYTSITGDQDYLAQMDACEKDDIYTLKTDLTATYSDAGTKCDPDGSYNNGHWDLEGNNIVVPGSSMDYAGTIKSFDGKTLVIEGKISFGVEFTFTSTFVKQ